MYTAFSHDAGKPHGNNSLAYAHFVLGTYTTVANTLVVIAVWKYKYLRTRANMYIVSLACTDICVGLVEYIIGWHNHTLLAEWFDRHGWACVGMFSFAFCSVMCSMMNMVLIALDRLVYIMKPFFYEREVTDMRVRIAIGVVWVLSFLWGTIPLWIHTYDEEKAICKVQQAIPTYYRSYMNVPALLLGAVTTVVAYIIIARKAIQHRNAILKSVPSAHSQVNVQAADKTEAAKVAIRNMKANMKTLKLFIVVFGLLFICWTPYYVFEFLSELYKVDDGLYRVSTALGFLNSGMNFIVYPMYDKNFRRALRSMLCPCLPEPNRDYEDTTFTVTIPIDKLRRTGTSSVCPTPVVSEQSQQSQLVF